MRKLLFLFVPVFAGLCAPSLHSQSFSKNDKVISGGIKISIYKVSNNDEAEGDGDDAAASYTIPIGFEYAVSDRIGVGIEAGICNYFTGKDTITGTIATANSFDVMLTGNFHWVRASRIDLYSGIGLGISAFKYESNDSRESQFTDTGTYLRIGLMNARFYVSKAIALSLHFGIPYMNFSNGRIDDNLGSDYEFPLTFTGIDLGTGLAIRF